MILKPGQKYYLRYGNYHVDPVPFLYVIWSDRKHTSGFNLHYLPNIKFKIPTNVYKKLPEATFKEAFENLVGAGYFTGFLKLLEEASGDPKMTRKEYQRLSKHLMKKYPWSQKAYRNYHSNQLRIRRNIEWG